MTTDNRTRFAWSDFKSDSFKFETVGDTITGTITDLAVRDGKHGAVPVVTLQLDDGSVSDVWAGAADLRQQLAALEPEIGTRLTITFVGEKHIGQPSPLKLFVVDTPSSLEDEGPF